MKAISLFITIIVFMVSAKSLEAQPTLSEDNKDKVKIVSQPLYKGVLFQQAIKNYIENTAINVYPSVFSLTTYYSEIKFLLRKNGSLKTVQVIKSTGNPELDHKIVIACKNFTKRKYVSPACSETGPVDYSFTVPFEVQFFNVPKENISTLQYQKAASFRGMTPYSVTHNKEYGTLH